MKLVNVGCGAHFHPDWINLDLASGIPEVREHDLRRGLPFSNDECDAVYHSHVLEHLDPKDARSLLAECHRVLKPGGVIRVVVPDLEGISKSYLKSLESENRADQDWMRTELIDQMVRSRSGGEMLAFVRDASISNRDFVESRIGPELFTTRPSRRVRKTIRQRLQPARLKSKLRKLRHSAALGLVTLVSGSEGRQAYREGLFRQSGEVHRWMYDRVSLGHTLESVGFTGVQVVRAEESLIRHFAKFELDSCEGKTRKPDSLFVEALKPGLPQIQAA